MVNYIQPVFRINSQLLCVATVTRAKSANELLLLVKYSMYKYRGGYRGRHSEIGGYGFWADFDRM